MLYKIFSVPSDSVFSYHVVEPDVVKVTVPSDLATEGPVHFVSLSVKTSV